MSRSSTLFAGLFGSFALSCFALVLGPQAQLGGLQQVYTEDEGKFSDIYPSINPSLDQGRSIYISEGCIYCHTQQVRETQSGTDIERGWGVRRTVARDYLFDEPPLLGSQRIGPDLTNIGTSDWRDETKDDQLGRPKKRDRAWEYLHLYAPRTIISSSNQPSYSHLFDTRKIVGQGSSEALKLSGEDAPKDGYEVVPKPEAVSLVSYLLSLDRSHPLKEATAAPGVAGEAGSAAAPASAPAK